MKYAKLSRTEMLSTVSCSKFHGASLTIDVKMFLGQKISKMKSYRNVKHCSVKQISVRIFYIFSIFAWKNAKINEILPPEAKWVEGVKLILKHIQVYIYIYWYIYIYMYIHIYIYIERERDFYRNQWKTYVGFNPMQYLITQWNDYFLMSANSANMYLLF